MTMPTIVYPLSGIVPYGIMYDVSGGAPRFAVVMGITLYNYLSYIKYSDFNYSVQTPSGYVYITLPTTIMQTPADVSVGFSQLTSVTYPSGAVTNYSYISGAIKTDNGYGTYSIPRLSSRKDTANGTAYNSLTYTYTDEKPGEIFVTNVKYPDGTAKRYRITNNLLTSLTLLYNDKPKFEDVYTYNNLRQKATYTNNIYNDAGAVARSTKEAYSFDASGNLTSYWDACAR